MKYRTRTGRISLKSKRKTMRRQMMYRKRIEGQRELYQTTACDGGISER